MSTGTSIHTTLGPKSECMLYRRVILQQVHDACFGSGKRLADAALWFTTPDFREVCLRAQLEPQEVLDFLKANVFEPKPVKKLRYRTQAAVWGGLA